MFVGCFSSVSAEVWPMLGSRPYLTANTYLRITARKKIGIETPIREMNRLRWSNQLPCHLAAKNPRGIPNPIATIIAAIASWTVAGKRWPISLLTERRDAMLTPRSPCAVVFRYDQYWVVIGLSRP